MTKTYIIFTRTLRKKYLLQNSFKIYLTSKEGPVAHYQVKELLQLASRDMELAKMAFYFNLQYLKLHFLLIFLLMYYFFTFQHMNQEDLKLLTAVTISLECLRYNNNPAFHG